MAYTNIDDPSAYFQAATYSGTGSSGNAITNDGNSDLQPDFVWIKVRTYNNDNVLQDSSRGFAGSGEVNVLRSNSTVAEGTNGAFASFDTNGFEVGGTNPASRSYNGSSDTYAAWQWKANGGTTSSNTDGTVTSTVQVNTDAGFSIVTWTTGVGSGNHSVGHGLGVKPAMFITKSRGGTSSWWTWHQGLTGDTSYVNLQTNTAELTFSDIWGDGITSSVFGYNYPATVYANQPYIAYCFAEKQGYSKFGKYVGNGNANGAFVYTGFKPEFVIVKRSDSANNWIITDNARGINGANPRLYADLADAEGSAADYIDHLSNGFKIRTSAGSMNTSGGTYIYMAFAENPFTTSTGIPTTAR